MSNPSVELLCVGDMHLGRRPRRVPAEIVDAIGGGAAELSPVGAWRRVVRTAIERRVAAVCLAGDVVDSANHFFEAYAPLADGVGELARAGIDVVAVAGNHDGAVLPRLADAVDSFHLLGRGGRWETRLVGGESVVRLLGWSFPEPRVTTSPLATLPAAYARGRYEDGAPGGTPTLGLLHCDLDATASPHAPVARRELDVDGVAAWCLGHIHAPSDLGGARPAGYLGSVLGLDPTETGPHGPWLARAGDGRIRLEHLPLSPLRWEWRAIDVTGARDEGELESRLLAAVREVAEEVDAQGDARVLGLRARLTGESAVPRARRAAVLERAREGLNAQFGGLRVFLDRCVDGARAPIALDELARDDDPAGILARLLLALETAVADCDALVERATGPLRRAAMHSVFHELERDELEPADVREHLARAARLSLDALLEQRAQRDTVDAR